MGRTHDVIISGFDLNILESKLLQVTEQRDRLQKIVDEQCRVSSVCREMKLQRDELAKALKEILPLLPTASCDMFHHSKKDRHEYGEECKPLARYNSKIKKAEEALMINKV